MSANLSLSWTGPTHSQKHQNKIKKLTPIQRLKLSKKAYREYINEAKKCGVERLSPILSLKPLPAFVSKPWLAEPIPTGYKRLGLTREEYREKVFNRRVRSKFPAPKKSKKSKGIKTIQAFRRLSLGPIEYREIIQNRSKPIKSLRAVKKPNKKVQIPGRKPLALKDRKNFDRLSMTKEERKQQKGFTLQSKSLFDKVGGIDFQTKKGQSIIKQNKLKTQKDNKPWEKKASKKNFDKKSLNKKHVKSSDKWSKKSSKAQKEFAWPKENQKYNNYKIVD